MSKPALLAIPIASLLALLVLAACGGGGSGGEGVQSLTDPQTVPTTTPWSQSPDVLFLEEDNIQPLPGESPAPTPTNGETGGGGTCSDPYVVESGDTPSGIAEKCGVDVDDLLDANPGLVPTKLQVGQELNLP
ncbi:MAG: LysM peptidoglycan-binding domain-containing protein [Chloroflexi bacterium]|nr:LysM peptidoglycan-binding domain-containing protein [Chloroflexota bacterium]